ncbi:hypothetical protein UFOVP244_150 [uncultured Caudovirales phage]|uniref:Uncharacterized protein n=1 Tax=uncultured Caudovirales phage TaxID=2100421 RepID=A0A6J7WTR4_9CAUD|nr:hypothetical protein UFOVP244_150 [uncultured Caudovirales phage]
MSSQQERKNTLKELSLKVYGSRSKWQKIQERRKYFSHVETLPSDCKAYKNAKKKYEHEVLEGRAEGEFVPPTRKVYLHPSDEQMIEILHKELLIQEYKKLTWEELVEQLKQEIKEQRIRIPLALIVTAGEKEEFTRTWDEVSEDTRTVLEQAQSYEGGLVVRGLKLLKALSHV